MEMKNARRVITTMDDDAFAKSIKNLSFFHPLVEANAKSCDVYIERLTQVKDKLQNLSKDVMDSITSAATNHNEDMSKLMDKYEKIQLKFAKILNIKNKVNVKNTREDIFINSNSVNSDEINLEEDLYQLISESSNCSEFLELCRHSEEVIRNLELLKEDINLKNYLINSHEFLRKNKIESKEKEAAKNSNHYPNYYLIDSQNEKSINSFENTNVIVNKREKINLEEDRPKKKRKRRDEDDDIDLNNIIEKTINSNIFKEEKKKKMLNNKRNRPYEEESTKGIEEVSSDHREDKEDREDKDARQEERKVTSENIIKKRNRKLKKSLIITQNSINDTNKEIHEKNIEKDFEIKDEGKLINSIESSSKIEDEISSENNAILTNTQNTQEEFSVSNSEDLEGDQQYIKGKKGYTYCYYNKSLKITKYPNNSEHECEESSEYDLKSFTIEKNDNVNDINLQFNINMHTIKKNLARNEGLLDNYILNNLEKCLQTRTLYFSEYIMTTKPFTFNYDYLSKDENFTCTGNFQNIKLVICRKGKQNIHNLIGTCEKFFDGYVKRKDKFGNAVIKGALSNQNSFDEFQNYFTQNMKSFDNVDSIQIEVYLFKWELFKDYHQKADKTSMTREEIMKYKLVYEALEKLRISDRKKKIIEKIK